MSKLLFYQFLFGNPTNPTNAPIHTTPTNTLSTNTHTKHTQHTPNQCVQYNLTSQTVPYDLP